MLYFCVFCFLYSNARLRWGEGGATDCWRYFDVVYSGFYFDCLLFFFGIFLCAGVRVRDGGEPES